MARFLHMDKLVPERHIQWLGNITANNKLELSREHFLQFLIKSVKIKKIYIQFNYHHYKFTWKWYIIFLVCKKTKI